MKLNEKYNSSEDTIAVPIEVFKKLLDCYINNGMDEELVESCRDSYEFLLNVGVLNEDL
jgi:hypothetical protein